MWTRFMDMHSGGGKKEDWSHIYIEAPEAEAKVIFYNRFGHSPERISCTCCGDDYSVEEGESLDQLTGYERNCEYVYFRPDGTECDRDEGWVPGKGMTRDYSARYVERQKRSNMDIRTKCSTKDDSGWGLYMSLDKYLDSGDALVIRADEIKASERKGYVPEQGYVWV